MTRETFQKPFMGLNPKVLNPHNVKSLYPVFRKQMILGQGTGIVRKSLRFRARFAIVTLLKQMVCDAVPHLL